MNWSQVHDPLNNVTFSTIMAALPIVVLLGSLAFFHVKVHRAALIGLIVALAVSILVFGMPTEMAGKTALWGALFGLLPIGWIPRPGGTATRARSCAMSSSTAWRWPRRWGSW